VVQLSSLGSKRNWQSIAVSIACRSTYASLKPWLHMKFKKMFAKVL